MARSTIQRRLEAERARIQTYDATLRRVTGRPRLPPDFQAALDDAARGLAA